MDGIKSNYFFYIMAVFFYLLNFFTVQKILGHLESKQYHV